MDGVRSWLGAAVLLVAIGCSRGEEGKEPVAEMPPPPAEPRRVAAADEDLRIMVSELAAAKACEQMRGQIRALRAADRPGVVTGIFWMKTCRIAQSGTRLTFHLGGDGWQWVEVVKRPAGATFALRQYVRFSARTELSGVLDIAYDPRSHVASFWFTPEGAPEVEFEPVGEIDLDEVGAWSAVVGALGSIVGSSPDEKGEEESQERGAHEFRKSFAGGFAVTLDLCTGLSRFGLERPPRGEMVTPDVGETREVPAEIHPGGLFLFGPHVASRGMKVDVHVRSGALRYELVCQDQGEALARAFMADPKRLPVVRTLASADVRGSATLRTRGVSCPVLVVARPIAGADRPAVFDWRRPASETARAAGGPIIQCENRKATR